MRRNLRTGGIKPLSPRAGSLLIEFALVALVLYLLLAAIITFGYLLYAAQSLQTTVDLAAREISRTPLPPVETSPVELTLGVVLTADPNDPQYSASTQAGLQTVRNSIYDARYLVLNLNTLHGRASLSDLIADLPLVNQQLINLMISDQIGGTQYLRYPGAVYQDPETYTDTPDPAPTGLMVQIPIIDPGSYDADDAPTSISWVPVVEPILNAAQEDQFSVDSEHRGIVALRINYPFQSAAMSGFRRQDPLPDDPIPPNMSRPIPADDGLITSADPNPGTLVPSDFEYGPYSGAYGLGQQAAMGSPELAERRPVRPFRRVLSVQAIYRREVFN